MKRRTVFYIFLIVLFSYATSHGQEQLQWINPLESEKEDIVHGNASSEAVFVRLPETLKDQVREPVWRLSRHAAGVKLRFHTDAKNIQVRYTVSGNIEMPHMPATGVSGLDLYTKNETSDWIWVKGDYSFGDTISYRFQLIEENSRDREFDLYLPLYNEVLFLEIGVAADATFELLPKEAASLPIVVYGTSIAQGACASRPGMAWTAILERAVNRPLINLGFSGNGQLEDPLIRYMASIESSLYVLDCLPNLVRDTFKEEEVKQRINDAVTYLKSKRPETPILLVDHAGYTDGLVNKDRREAYEKRNQWSQEVYGELLALGVSEVYYLEKDAIGLSMEGTVDGTHPSDLGMDQYARGYANLITEILY
ncbi:SGNH/GDSL hydrolase family protein [Cyclobacterium jeungdonense]|uniref:SGNH/GDSL hydrolase family protein n=1 Tax=Cyclobacterium jeungdonense TaxID=708087 RepID=A0ABT8CF33_9BACT|nr:SGNH/GDSL hydrolase family protein [Cyclobacterium jeungdonense]MDN3690330.1 SGNH/GDSL hydrolase family protein [Cyclobacterium jeungdonense]